MSWARNHLATPEPPMVAPVAIPRILQDRKVTLNMEALVEQAV